MESSAWTAKDVVATLMLPPASPLLIGLGLWFSRRHWGHRVAGAALTLLSIPAVGVALGTPHERAYPPLDLDALKQHPSTGRMIVILGGGRDLGGIEHPKGERLNAASLRRARYGAHVARELGVSLAVAGGRPGGGRHSEAALIQQFIERELRGTVAVIEDTSRNTRQTLDHLAPKLRALGVKHVLLVTDVTHMPWARRAIMAADMQVTPAPLNHVADAPRSISNCLPQHYGLQQSGRVIRELLGELWYRAGATA